MKVSLLKWIGAVVFFSMTCFISVYTIYKIPFIFIYLFIYFIIYDKGIRVSNSTKLIIGLIICYGFIGLFSAIAYNNDTFLKYLTVPLLWPFAYLIFISSIKSEEDYLGITKILIIAHIFILFYDLLFVAGIFFGFHVPDIYQMDQEVFTIYSDQTRINFVNLRTLTFTTPFIFILTLGNFKTGFHKYFLYAIILLTFFLFIISGRRMQMLTGGMLIFTPFFFRRYFTKSISRIIIKSIFIFSAILGLLYFWINLKNPEIVKGYTNIFLKAFDSSQEPIKFKQSHLLLDAFSKSPLFGNGFGMKLWEEAKGVHSIDFELSYQLKLAWTGISGFFAIMLAYVYTIIKGLDIAKKNDDLLLIAFLIGYIFVLIADATNPYLTSFDTLWPLYLCVSKINNYELYNKKIE